MKNFLAFGILSFIIISAASAQIIQRAELQVTGLTCSMCSQATQKSLETISSISSITPDLNRGIFVLKFKNNAQINFDLIQQKVDEAGFSVGALTATIQFDNVKVDNSGQAVVGNSIYRFADLKNKTLNGEVKITLIDKDFVSKSTFKKYSSKMSLGLSTDGSDIVDGKKTRIYNVTIS